MKSTQFLTVGGWIYVLIAIAGAMGLLGPTPDRSLFGTSWYFTAPENWGFFLAGVVSLFGALTLSRHTQRLLVGGIGLVAVILGIWSFFAEGHAPNFYGANLESPLDSLLYFGIAFWSYLAMGDNTRT